MSRTVIQRAASFAIVHSVGVCATLILTHLWIAGPSHFRLVVETLFVPEFAAFTAQDAAHAVVIAAMLWTLVYATFRRARRHLDERKRSSSRVVSLARGTVVTETLIILPFALTLYFGLAQLAINNVAGILTNLAAFQAGRSMFIWLPEAHVERRETSMDYAIDMARIQAALVLTPVAPADYFTPIGIHSPQSEQTLNAIVGMQLPFIADDLGSYASTELSLILSLEDAPGLLRQHTRANQSMTRGLDATSFRLRSIRKFTFAYNATMVIPMEVGPTVGATLIYAHHNSMPLVGRMFGKLLTIGGRKGYYAVYKRIYVFPLAQRDPNPEMP